MITISFTQAVLLVLLGTCASPLIRGVLYGIAGFIYLPIEFTLIQIERRRMAREVRENAEWAHETWGGLAEQSPHWQSSADLA